MCSGLDRAYMELFAAYTRFETGVEKDFLPDSFWVAQADGFNGLARNLFNEEDLAVIYQEHVQNRG